MRPAWLFLAFAACLDPTEVKVRLTSDACDSIAETEIFLGSSTAASATTTTCLADIGSIVMIPANARDATFTIRASACDKTKAHCIKASRRVGFIPHTPLELPIALDRACMDVMCSPDQTCSKGGCVPDDVSKRCVDNVCEPPAPDGGPPNCSPPWVNPPSNASSAIIWHFDDPLPHRDDNMLCVPSMIGTTAGMTGCQNAASDSGFDAGAPPTLGCGSSSLAGGTSFHVAFWFLVPSIGAAAVSLVQHATSTGGWGLVIDGTRKLTVQGHVPNTTSNLPLGGQLAPGSWHAVEVVVSNGVLTGAWLDKQPVMIGALMLNPSPNTAITIGPLFGAQVDELYIYP